jgi:hypothetical protein
MARLSGLQKDVLALYRSILRQAVHKDRISFFDNKSKGAESLLHYPPVNKLLSSSSSTTAYARDKFRKEAQLLYFYYRRMIFYLCVQLDEELIYIKQGHLSVDPKVLPFLSSVLIILKWPNYIYYCNTTLNG